MEILMIADNKKHQANLNKALSWLIKYNDFNTKRDLIADNLDCYEGESKEWHRMGNLCEKAFDKYLDYEAELPKYQVKKIEKSKYY